MPMRLLLLLLTMLVALPAHAQLPVLQGDAEAVARIEKMYRHLGGREPWAAMRSMHIRYRQLHSGGRQGEAEELAWRDMTAPRERLEWVITDHAGVTTNFGRGNDENSAWRRRPDGTRVDRTAQDLKLIKQFWHRDFYTMFKRMAAGDPGIRYGYIAPNRIVMTDPSGGALGWWEIDAGGWLLQWGTADDDGSPLAYFYGPYKSYGNIAFPAWGVSAEGTLRFEYLTFEISPAPFPEEALRDSAKSPGRELRLR
jgi:hypothetical protein